MAGGDGKTKLYEVLKALTAMRLCKEDSAPCSILSRRKNDDGSLSDLTPSPHPEGADEGKPYKYEVVGDITFENSEGCYF